MKLSIDTASEFRNQFIAYNRDNFTCQGYELLFDYFEDIDPDMVLDVISICCDYSEDTLSDIAENYAIDLEGLEGEDRIEAVVNYLEENTTVIGLVNDETVVYAVF